MSLQLGAAVTESVGAESLGVGVDFGKGVLVEGRVTVTKRGVEFAGCGAEMVMQDASVSVKMAMVKINFLMI